MGHLAWTLLSLGMIVALIDTVEEIMSTEISQVRSLTDPFDVAAWLVVFEAAAGSPAYAGVSDGPDLIQTLGVAQRVAVEVVAY